MTRRWLAVLGTIAGGLCVVAAARGDAFIGDAGHFIAQFSPDIFISNPAGRAFSVTVHRHIWDTDFGNTGTYRIAVQAPGGVEVAKGAIPALTPKTTLKVPAGERGTYKLIVQPGGYGLTWVECSLDRMVVATGDWDMKDGSYKYFNLHAMAPRRWYFYVPPGVKKFQIKHTIMPFQSHKEDYGFFVMSPRGQRLAALYGGKPLEVETRTPNVPIPIIREIEVDEGTAGRFWSLWVTGGDSHNFSDMQILLKDVPPFLAPAPEQWFDPAAGRAPEKIVYDESHVRLLDKACQPDARGRIQSRDHYLWAPAVFLGDEDYNGMRGPHTIYLNNPANRAIDFGVGAYAIHEKERLPVSYRVGAPDGKLVFEGQGTYGHHANDRIAVPASGAGVYRIDVDAPEWFAWNEPATPIVLAGAPQPEGGFCFKLQIGIARHWFFLVPKGIRQFRVAVAVADPAHVLLAEIHAPDRMADQLYVRGSAAQNVILPVPEGLDGKIWFLRTEVGSATRFVSEAPGSASSRVRINADVTLYGVPGYLAPTWEQWFDPKGE